MRFSPDGSKIAVGDAGREIKVWEVGNDVPVITRKWMSHQSTITTICWSPEGDRVISGAVDGKLIVWNMNAPRQINEKPLVHPGGVFCVEWTQNNIVYSCGDDACVREIQLVMWCVCFNKQGNRVRWKDSPLHSTSSSIDSTDASDSLRIPYNPNRLSSTLASQPIQTRRKQKSIADGALAPSTHSPHPSIQLVLLW